MPSPSSHTELPDSSSLRHILAVAHSPVAEPGVARTLATELGLDWLGVVAPKQVRDYGLLLFMDEHGLALQQTGKGAPGPVRAEFVSGKMGRLHTRERIIADMPGTMLRVCKLAIMLALVRSKKQVQ